MKVYAMLRDLIKRAALLRVDDSRDHRSAQVTYYGKVVDGVDLFTPYGFDHNPPAGCAGPIWNVAAQEENQVAMVALPARRPRLNEGEVAVSNYITGDTITFGGDDLTISGRTINIQCSTLNVIADNIDITAAVSITGSFSVNGKDVGDTHRHSGVVPGTSNTGGVA